MVPFPYVGATQRGQRTSTSPSGERSSGREALEVNESEHSCRLPVTTGQIGTPKLQGCLDGALAFERVASAKRSSWIKRSGLSVQDRGSLRTRRYSNKPITSCQLIICRYRHVATTPINTMKSPVKLFLKR